MLMVIYIYVYTAYIVLKKEIKTDDRREKGKLLK